MIDKDVQNEAFSKKAPAKRELPLPDHDVQKVKNENRKPYAEEIIEHEYNEQVIRDVCVGYEQKLASLRKELEQAKSELLAYQEGQIKGIVERAVVAEREKLLDGIRGIETLDEFHEYDKDTLGEQDRANRLLEWVIQKLREVKPCQNATNAEKL